MRNHLLIAGTGRAGTSLLVRILHACGLDTEISRRGGAVFWDDHANAGIENIPIVGDDHPYVVKSPFSYQFIRELLARADIKLDGVLIPVRDLDEAVASRIILELRHRYEYLLEFASQVEETWRDWGTVPGGVTYSLEPLDQARILAHSLHRIIEPLVDAEIPIHFLKFPKFTQDIEYLHRRLIPVLPDGISFAAFSARVAPVIDVRKVRTTSELSEAQRRPDAAMPPVERPQLHDAAELPSFETLDHIALKRALRSVAGNLQSMTAERNELVAQHEALTTDRNDLLAQRNALAADNAKLEARLADLAAEQKQALAGLDQFVNSTSWRLTRPMRTVVEHVRNLKRPANGRG
jgi:hypothetical protein